MDSKSPPILFRGGPCRWLLPVEWLALFLGAFLLLRCPLGMDDFFYLTRSGEYLLQTGHVLAVNLFSFTAPDHPWINHAWLSGLVFHLVHSGLGLPGVVALNAGCYLAAGLLFARNLRRCGAGPVARLVLILIYAGAVAKPYAVVRPWIFSHILFQCLLGLWLASREEADPRTVRKRLAMGVFIVWLWLNLHGSFYVGLLTFFLQLFTLRFQTKKQDSTNKNVHSTSVPELLLWAVFAVGLLSLNPYGTSYLVVPFQFLRGAVNLKAGGAYLAHLEEWASVLSFALFMDYLSAALGLVILAFIAVKTFRRQIRFSDWPRLVFFAASAMLILVAHRNDYFFLTANLCLFYPVMFSRRPQTDGDSVAAVSDRRNPPPRNEQPAVRDRRYSLPLRELSIALVDDAAIAAINQQFLHHAGPTDVISFNLGDGLGEIVVSAERAVIVARQLRRPPAAELALYLVHGLLHIAGYDDHTPAQRRAMRTAERRVLRQFKIQSRVRETNEVNLKSKIVSRRPTSPAYCYAPSPHPPPPGV